MTTARVTPADGFTMIEMLIATTVAVAALAVILGLVDRAQTVLRVLAEQGDVHQRLRAAADALSGSIGLCRSVRPYRIGAVRDDGVSGIYYRPDAIATVVDGTMTTFYLKPETSQLMEYDGGRSDLPFVDHVVRLAFDYFGPVSQPGTALIRIDPGQLIDGPWSMDATGRRFDVDVLRISEVRATIGVEGTAPSLRRLVPSTDVVMHAALRNSTFAR